MKGSGESIMEWLVDLQKLKRLWSDWEIRGFLLLSLFLQCLLIVLGPCRRRNSSVVTRFFIWIPYLLADMVAIFALGHLADSLYKAAPAAAAGAGVCGSASIHNDVVAFWSPFLLIHLAGPDTVTAFSIEDNALWRRHLLLLATHLAAAAWVVFRSLPNPVLLTPTLLLLAVGVVKYVERTWSLYLASTGGFRESLLPREDAGPNYAVFMQEYSAITDAGFEADIVIVREIESELEAAAAAAADVEVKELSTNAAFAVRRAYEYFKTFKCVVVDLVLSFRERRESRQLLLFLHAAAEGNADVAFRLIETELNFLYDVFYTKAPVVHGLRGYSLRALCFAAVLASFFMFFTLDKGTSARAAGMEVFCPADIRVTYVLLGGAVVIEALAIAMLLFSDWAVVSLRGMPSWVPAARQWMRRWRHLSRWSGMMSQFNLLTLCLHLPPDGKGKATTTARRQLGLLADVFQLREWWEGVMYTSTVRVTVQLQNLIFDELQRKSREAKDLPSVKDQSERRGSHFLASKTDIIPADTAAVLRDTVDGAVDLEESLLLWHLATTLCYYDADADGADDGAGGTNRNLSKHLSDYMLYLLVLLPELTSTVTGIGLLQYRSVREEMRSYCEHITSPQDAAKNLLLDKHGDENTGTANTTGGEKKGRAVLLRACELAKALKGLEKKEMWEVVAGVWVEQLSYLACHCRGMSHARQLSYGGELLTLVWFLMVHLGLGPQYRTEAGYARALLEEK